MKLLKRLFREEEGAGLVEYALLVAFIALAVVIAAGSLGDAIAKQFEDIATAIGLWDPQ